MKPFNHFTNYLLTLPRLAKRVVVLAIDIGLSILSVWLAFSLRLDEWVKFTGVEGFQPLWATLISLVLAIPIFITHGFYRVIFRYSRFSAVSTVTRAFALYAFFYVVIVTVIGIPNVPRSIGILQPMLFLLGIGITRAIAYYYLGGIYQSHIRRLSLPKVLIYGAGTAGRQLAVLLRSSYKMRVVGFIDDAPQLHGHTLNGILVYHSKHLKDLILRLKVTTILLAIPSVSRDRRHAILQQIRTSNVAVRTIPSLHDLVQGRVDITDIHELDIDDLLGREVVPPNVHLLEKNIRSKVVLVTGAGGSIGSELCRQIMRIGPEKLLLIEQNEFALYTIHQELERKYPQVQNTLTIIPILASVQDIDRIRKVMLAVKPDTIYHTAAYKHVPLVEHNPFEGIKNNTLGTLKLAEAALENRVSDFVLISTDKAVRPTNIMGASKRLAEIILQVMASDKAMTRFSIVRFGNVLGSSGSVVPKFREQIRHGGPVTLTHPQVTRYFMSIAEAAQLVIQAGAIAKGGEVFVLDMGAPVKIMDLARQMISLSGHTIKDSDHPMGDIEIVITGLRPGEKLFEELLINNERQEKTVHPKIVQAFEDYPTSTELQKTLEHLETTISNNDYQSLCSLLKRLVAGYRCDTKPVDWLYLQKTEV
jgi:FlaA1/EpsC-like NDP-sugar epimerase